MPIAIRFHQTGGPEVLRAEELPAGAPGAGEVRVRHTAVGVNFIDTYHRTGLYPLPLPSGLGSEAAGVVEAVGPGVGHVAPGDRVAYAGGAPGSYAQVRVMPADRLVKLPEGISDRQAAEAVRARIDWKYALHLPLEHEGFDFSVLSEFRDRLIAHQQGQVILDRLPSSFPIPVVIVQHMPVGFTAAFAERLNHSSRLTVREATEGEFLGELLVRLGLTTEAKIIKALQDHLNIEYIDLKELVIPQLAARFLPRDLCERNRILPVKLDDRQLVLAMADPSDIYKCANIALMTGLKVTQTSSRDLDVGPRWKFRLVIQEDMLELYVNEYLMNLKRARWNGRIGFTGSPVEDSILTAWLASTGSACGRLQRCFRLSDDPVDRSFHGACRLFGKIPDSARTGGRRDRRHQYGARRVVCRRKSACYHGRRRICADD